VSGAERWEAEAADIRAAAEQIEPPVFDYGEEATPFTDAADVARMMNEIEGKPEPLSAVLDEMARQLERFVRFADPHQLTIAVLYAAATHTVEEWWNVPYLHVTSPDMESGKSTLIKAMRHLSWEPLLVANVSTAFIYRKLDQEQSTMFIDEFDNLIKSSDELAGALFGILNTGYDRELAKVGRTAGRGHDPVIFDCFGFKVFAGIGDINPVVASRTIKVNLQRAFGYEIREQYDPGEGHIEQLQETTTKLEVALGETVMSKERPVGMPEEIANRTWQLWRPLFAVAEAAGDEWLLRSFDAARWSAGGRDVHQAAIVRDIAIVLDDDDKLNVSIAMDGRGEVVSTLELVAALVRMDESVWDGTGEYARLSRQRLATLLHPFGVKAGHRVGRDNDKSPSGYLLAELQDVVKRYGPHAHSLPLGDGVRLPHVSQTLVGTDGADDGGLLEEVSEASDPPHSGNGAVDKIATNLLKRDLIAQTGSVIDAQELFAVTCEDLNYPSDRALATHQLVEIRALLKLDSSEAT